MSYDPLVVTAEMGSSYVGDPSAPLDGVLLYVAMRREHGGDVPPLLPGTLPDYDPLLVPLEIVAPDHEQWFYACSWAQWAAGYADSIDHWNKRLDLAHIDHLGEDTRRVNIKSARYKAYHQTVYYRASRTISWYVRGDAGAVADLLNEVDFIGGKTSQGWGRVLRWRIAPVSHDKSLLDDEGYPMRAIPTILYHQMQHDTLRMDLTFAERGYRPPYWHRANQGKVFVPEGIQRGL